MAARATAAGPAVPPGAGRPRFQRLRVIFALMVREMGARFGRSAGGYLWAIAEPLGGIVLLSVAFALALRSPPIGTSFMLFYATGIVPMSMFTSVSRGVAGSIGSNRGLLTYPVVGALDAVLAKFGLSFMTNLVTAILLFAGVILGAGAYVVLDLGQVALAFALAGLLGLGIGTLNCVLFGFFPTWKNVWSVLTRPLLILSGVLFLYEQVPANFQAVLWWNPLAHVIAVMRAGFYGTYEPTFVSLPYVIGVSLAAFVIGGYLIRRHASWLIEQ